MYDEPLVATNDNIMDVYRTMPNGEGFWWKEWIDENFIKVLKITEADLIELDKDASLFHVVSLGQRDLSTKFMSHLEDCYFHPTSGFNDEFSFRLFKWEDLDWVICTVPVAKASTCYLTASAVDCRLANGVPHILASGASGKSVGNARSSLRSVFGGVSESIFPLQSDRTFTLEPDHKRRGPVVSAFVGGEPAPAKQLPREPDILDIIMARRKKK